MLPRLRFAHVTVVALACAVALGHARGGEPGKKVQKVYAVADLVVPITDWDLNLPGPCPSPCAANAPCCKDAAAAAAIGCDFEFMCQQPASEPCCQGGSCCQAAAKKSCPNCAEVNGECSEFPAKAKCGAASCCPNGACCPDGPCCGKGACGGASVRNWSMIAAPECYKSATPVRTAGSNAELLIKLIRRSVCPECWTDDGCTLAYCPMGMGLIVSAPADVQEQVGNLLDQLRQLQNLQVAFEVRLVRVADGAAQKAFDADAQAKLAAGQPLFLCCGKLKQLQGTIQTDSHTELICAPKMTVSNGQKATIRCTDERYFVTSVNMVKFQDQVVYVPVNNKFPLGFNITVRPTVSADHRFVRCELNAEQTDLRSDDVPLFPVTTQITPIFEGGAQGSPVPFTQFVQQPEVITRGVSKALVIPDGCTAVLDAGQRTKEDRSEEPESGCPLFDWINDLVDLCYPPAPVPTYQEHLYVLVTPRVILTEQLEAAAKPMPAGPLCPPVDVAGYTNDLAIHVQQCAATAPACPAAKPCPVAACPAQCQAAASCQQQVQLDVCLMSIDPRAWDQPATAAWSDLSPKAADGQPKVIPPEVAQRFCRAMHAQNLGKCLAEPKMVTNSGRPATFLSGGQQAIPETTASGEVTGTRFEPFGTQVRFLPTVVGDGKVRLALEACISSLNESNGYCVGGVSVAGRDEHRTKCDMALASGQTVLMYGGSDREGRDLMVMVTPHLTDPMRPAHFCPVAAMPPPVAYAPPPAPGQTCPPCVPAPMPPTVWAAPVPVVQDIMVTSGQSKPAESKLDHLLALYHLACQEGDAAEARKLARKCMAIDPTCFGK